MPKQLYKGLETAHDNESRDFLSVEDEFIKSLYAARDRRNHQYHYMASKIRKCDEEIAAEKASLAKLKEDLGSGVKALDADSADSPSSICLEDIKKSVKSYEETMKRINVSERYRNRWILNISHFQYMDDRIKGIVANMPTYRGPSIEDDDDCPTKSSPEDHPMPEFECPCDACNIDQYIAPNPV